MKKDYGHEIFADDSGYQALDAAFGLWKTRLDRSWQPWAVLHQFPDEVVASLFLFLFFFKRKVRVSVLRKNRLRWEYRICSVLREEIDQRSQCTCKE